VGSSVPGLKDTEIGALEEFKKALMVFLGGSLVMLRLFGSKARGDYGEDSDIDVAVVVKGEPGRAEKERIFEIAFELTYAADYSFNLTPVIFGEDEFNRLRDQEWRIALDILAEGRDI